jgi:hypothetical protein
MRSVRQKIEIGEVVVKWVPSKDNVADVLTKPLVGKEHRKFAEMLGLVGWKEEKGVAWGSRWGRRSVEEREERRKVRRRGR